MINVVARSGRVMVRAVLCCLAAGLVACTSPTSPTVKAAFETIDLRVGTGAAAATGQTVMVNYAGYLYDDTKSDKKGAQFDASAAGQPFVFQLGKAQVIQGWDEGVPGMKVGGLRKLIIPSAMAYGRLGAGSSIPPNATLVFEIELLSIASGS